MDWPILGAIGGVSVLTVAVSVAAVVMVRATPDPPKKPVVPTSMAPLMKYETRPEVGVLNGVQTTTLNPADFAPGTQPARVPPKAAPQAPQQQAAPPVRRNPPPEQVARPVAPQPEQLQAPSPTHGPVASRPTPPSQNPARPQAEPPRADQRYEGVLTLPEISRIKANLRLTPQQEPQWRPVEAVMRDIGRQQTAQINAGRQPEVDQASGQRLYQAAQPLLATLRPDQKEQLRRLARQMGYESIAARL